MTQAEESINIDNSNSVQIIPIDIRREGSLFQFISQLNGWYRVIILAGDLHLFGFNVAGLIFNQMIQIDSLEDFVWLNTIPLIYAGFS